MQFEVAEFVADCRAALAEGQGAPAAIRELLGRTVVDPGRFERRLGPLAAMPSMSTWHRSEDLTVLHLVWPPDADLAPHDHGTWAAIGLYGGQEDNHFYRRRPDGRVEAAGGRVLRAGAVTGLGPAAVHRVVNPTRQWTGAIHVYGGDFFTLLRTSWSLRTLEPRPFDAERVRDYLEASAAVARGAASS